MGGSPLDAALLPAGTRSRLVAGVNGLRMHLIEAGHETPGQPLLVLLHGFPELGYSWRKLLLPLAAAGYHVVAPDQRGYGQTSGWEPAAGTDISYGVLDWVRDVIALVSALGHRRTVLVGHDFGAQIAATVALARPDLCHALALMSSPFPGPPELPFDSADRPQPPTPTATDVQRELAALVPPRKHYQAYFSTPQAETDMHGCAQGVHAFLRAYFHVKSADWAANRPHPLAAYSATELARLPTYYVMRLEETMPETVAHAAPTAAEVAACRWLTEAELEVYSRAFERVGFRGALQFYRCRTSGSYVRDLTTFSGRTIDLPACFISGRHDWGPYQKAGDLERMQRRACSRMGDPVWIEGAGHWVQQEQPEACARALLQFLDGVGAA